MRMDQIYQFVAAEDTILNIMIYVMTLLCNYILRLFLLNVNLIMEKQIKKVAILIF